MTPSAPGAVVPGDALGRRHDVLLLDLDGVVYRGPEAVPHAVEALTALHDAGTRLAFVTNNASRTPEAVAAQLLALGVPAAPADVVTSAQAGARLVAGLVPVGSPVLAAGGDGVVAALEELGLRPVRSADDEPAAVLQGFDPGLGWAVLAEAAYAVARGVPWVATNTDLTIPTGRGTAPGNGTLVGAVATATGRSPIVAGKPEPPLMDESVLRTGATAPLVIGDRLDTDIAGGAAIAAPTALVLTGVSTLAAALAAPAGQRPTHLLADLRGLLRAAPEPAVLEHDRPPGSAAAASGPWRAVVDGGLLSLERLPAGSPAEDRAAASLRGGADDGGRGADGAAAVTAGCAACWAALDAGAPLDPDAAAEVLAPFLAG